MRFHSLLVLLVVFSGISAAQETNFPVGPQYLITTENTMLLRSIATPSLSLSGETLAGTSEVPRPVEPPAFAPVETIIYLRNVYWGEHQPDEVLAQRLEPPVMAPDQTAWYMNYVANQSPTVTQAPAAEAAEATAAPYVIELTGGPMPSNLPSSMFDTGVTGMTDPQSLLQGGNGISLGEVAAYWKTHKRQSPHIFTNQDVHRK